jgi:hypothetical protein
MSDTGEIAFYTKRDNFEDIYSLLNQSIEIFEFRELGPEYGPKLKFYTENVCNKWEMFQRYRDGIDRDLDTFDYDTCLGETDFFEEDFIRSIDFSKKVLTVWSWQPTNLSGKMSDIIDKIPEEIRGSLNYMCGVDSVGVVIGYEDIYTPFECQKNKDGELEEGTFFGRAFYRFQILLRNTAGHSTKFRRIINHTPEIKELKQKLESFAGPLQTCIFWE